ncbi:MAG: VOC family protein [Ardenticatenales bacterium]|nr:VOC family protein [Ardenticatenales bacterium]
MSNQPEPFSLSSQTRLGHVHLTVANLERQIAFYTQVLGFKLHWQAEAEAALGTEAEVLLRLSEDGAARRYQQNAGMYHFAILYPSRKALARAIARLFALRYPNSPTDHGISLTTYLDDLEGNNIELYIRTLGRATFAIENGQPVVYYADGTVGNGRDPLDLEALFAELTPGEGLDGVLPAGTRLGHMHLYVGSIAETMHFYRDLLGFAEGPIIPGFRMGEVGLDETQPHVIAFNTWKGEGLPPAPPQALGLRYFTVVAPDAAEWARLQGRVAALGLPVETDEAGITVRDPAGIRVRLTERMLGLAPAG